jgi:hypothetical protein
MSLAFLFGAILGSGIFIFAGREPAQRLLAIVQEQLERARRRN